jgi:hypothetical protein
VSRCALWGGGDNPYGFIAYIKQGPSFDLPRLKERERESLSLTLEERLQPYSLQEYTSHSSIREKRRRDTSARPHTAARTRQELGSRLTQSPDAFLMRSAAQRSNVLGLHSGPTAVDGCASVSSILYSLLGVMRSLLGVKRGCKRRQRAI